ncbi:hypothetical protein ACGFYU_22380 [Streptomyces sp. NPDC048337]|uniref:hypothetical protein n=1 Tax=Streptomyces sp. NPDC048337 TaxID=3365535 RepID=UPI0037240361
MSARRPLLTALGATTLLGALWFVPSANATAPGAAEGRSGVPAAANSGGAEGAGAEAQEGSAPVPLSLADTGSIDTTPYLLGGTVCLGIGAGFVTYSVRRSRAL